MGKKETKMPLLRDLDLEGKVVVLGPPRYKGFFLFHCKGGSGCDPHARGSSIGGNFLVDEEWAKIDRRDVLRLATEEEIKENKVI
jgi:hypothetical protein